LRTATPPERIGRRSPASSPPPASSSGSCRHSPTPSGSRFRRMARCSSPRGGAGRRRLRPLSAPRSRSSPRPARARCWRSPITPGFCATVRTPLELVLV